MTALEKAIKNALDLSGSTTEANKAYLEFIKANFIIPVDIESNPDDPEVLFLEEQGQTLLPVFTDMTHLNNWAHDISDKIRLLKLSGVDLLKGMGEHVSVCLNPGSTVYKEFNPSELARMRSMVIKFFSS